MDAINPPKKRIRRGRRSTSPAVRVADRIARALITFGGIGTIVAVSTVCLFLAWVVLPLFESPSLEAEREGPALTRSSAGNEIHAAANEYLTMVWGWRHGEPFRCIRLATGEELAALDPFAGVQPTGATISSNEGTMAFGFADGSLRSGSIGFATSFLEAEEVPAPARDMALGEELRMGAGTLERTPTGQFRRQELFLDLGEPLTIAAGHAIRLLDEASAGTAPVYATLADDGVLRLVRATKKTNLLTGKETVAYTRGELALELPPGRSEPRWLLLAGRGDNVFLAWEDGWLWRYDARDFGAIQLAEKVDLVPEDGVALTALCFLIGRTSFVAGDANGRAAVWFRVKPEGAETLDGSRLVRAHELPARHAAVRSLSPSARSRALALGYDDGEVVLVHVTSGRVLASARFGDGGAVLGVALSPKDDALLAVGNAASALWRIDAPHPETSFAAVFTPVWYEGYGEPEHVWQSSSGTDDFEPKYGLMPLVFGTIKATFYSLLFGVPLAILAALYTSEFMHARTKALVKPTIEIMASLPSVVLGFLSALVIAPMVEDVVPQVLASLAAIPFVILLGAYAWQLLPKQISVRYESKRLLVLALLVPLGVLLGAGVGAPLERWLFAGDIRQWLAEGVGSAVGGWMLLLLPASGILVAWFVVTQVNPWLLGATARSTRRGFALADGAKFLGSSAAVVLLALVLSSLFSALGFDPRGGVIGTYVQRNALVVGFIMGFAIIPIVYTIAEDALSAVPEHLRAASLGCGATPWQTAVRIIAPTAMSGLFSAIMIGFGRAVGETMIVLMAAGNTPIMDWNVFNGFRTLSANLAFELPEAVQGSTHYRMLFLAALVLFAMTFVLNTAAEIVRQRFRRRSVRL